MPALLKPIRSYYAFTGPLAKLGRSIPSLTGLRPYMSRSVGAQKRPHVWHKPPNMSCRMAKGAVYVAEEIGME